MDRIKLFCPCMHDPKASDKLIEEKDWHIEEIVPLNRTELKKRIEQHKKECKHERTCNL